jgi:hypothetical protein
MCLKLMGAYDAGARDSLKSIRNCLYKLKDRLKHVVRHVEEPEDTGYLG